MDLFKLIPVKTPGYDDDYDFERVRTLGTRYDSEGLASITWYICPIEEKEKIAELFPATYCQHSYDCCANWYQSPAYIIHENDIYGYIIVEQHSHQNI